MEDVWHGPINRYHSRRNNATADRVQVYMPSVCIFSFRMLLKFPPTPAQRPIDNEGEAAAMNLPGRDFVMRQGWQKRPGAE
jgi:hypothetical protein